MAHKSTAEPSYDGTHVITQKKKRDACDQNTRNDETYVIKHQTMPKHMRSNTRNTGTYMIKQKKCRNMQAVLISYLFLVHCPGRLRLHTKPAHSN